MRKHGLPLGPGCRILLLVIAGLTQAFASAYAEPRSDRPAMHEQAVAGSVQSPAKDEPAENPVMFTSIRQRASDRFLTAALYSPAAPPVPMMPGQARWQFQGTAAFQTTTRPKRSGMGWGIAIGIGAGVGVAGLAARSYGENEGGEFCTRCFVQWSAVAVPVGAGVGAAIGYLIDRARR